ncbi:MAG: hypothetical protein A3F73_14200 [Gallionellales bacterium RIFCSPLOWO2_12_FULL_59_22]|nr:MAG: hypothetical protein A3H99_01680 [Gallionellales bacterium RIFCSPLOWO2_02_FULL_59_110]OGT14708.1 MAG: hypothetical protein A3F73_14200 [Gallionellales bacterium RIFCSPLOWO2_12_FULL_59_22]
MESVQKGISISSSCNKKLHAALVIAGLAFMPFALTGCNSSSGGGTTEPPSNGGGTEPPPPPPPPAAAFKVNFADGAPSVNWGSEVTVTAFRPGQASHEYLSTAGAGHTGAPLVAMGCAACHETNLLNPPQVAAKHDEDEPVHDIATVDLKIAAAYDASNFYLKASWQAERPGITHGRAVYKNGAWVKDSMANEPGADPAAVGKVFAAEDRFATMFMPASKDVNTGNAGLSFHTAGCFVTCHNDMDDMPEWNAAGKETLKYLVRSKARTEGASNGATKFATGTETDADVTSGATQNFPDMWHWRGGRSAIINTVTDGFVMQSRANDGGSNFYADNTLVTETGWMYDASWMEAWITANFPNYTGEKKVHALPAALWDQALQNTPTLVTAGANKNAVAYNATTAKFQEGDILPQRVLTPKTGSRSDVNAYASWESGTWTVIFKRARDTGNKDDHVLNFDAENYSFAFAAHQDHTQHRWHHVTYPVTMGKEGSNATIKAKLN